jgi:hypothetical protein
MLTTNADPANQKPKGHTMSDQDLTPDLDDTEGHLRHGRDDEAADDTEGHLRHGVTTRPRTTPGATSRPRRGRPGAYAGRR